LIQSRLRELMAATSRETRRKITYDVIWSETGLSRTTLARLANDREERIAISTLDRLCAFFDCQPGDLLIYVPTPQQART